MSANKIPLVALAGSPNCGKTAIFNSLTGARQKTANYPGVTVEKKEGFFKTGSGQQVRVLDLPGTYSLDARSPDEAIARDIVFEKLGDEYAPEVLLVVVDATHLERTLGFALELKQTGKPIVLTLNMMDLAKKRGLKIDLDILSQELGMPVVSTVAVKNEGISELVQQVDNQLQKKMSHVKAQIADLSEAAIQKRFEQVDQVLKKAATELSGPALWTARIDKLVTHPFWGLVILAGIMSVMFQAVFTWAGPFQDLIEGGVGALSTFVASLLPEGPLNSLLTAGVIEGVGAVIVFLPQIIFLFLFILFLEDVGYMARAAFLMDRLMGGVGLHGRALIPLLSSFACAIPGIMATRAIQNPRDRLATMMVAPLMTCAARLPVYTLLIAAFIPNTEVFGPFRAQGLVMFGLYAAGVIAALAVAWIMKKTILKGEGQELMLELPTYKIPSWKNLVIGLWERARVFLKRAGTVILSLTILLWFLVSYPNASDPDVPAIQQSYAGQLGKAIEPVLAPLGFDWRVSIALIPGFAAREVMVGALATVYAVEGAGEDEEKEAEALTAQIGSQWSLATALSLLMWYIFAPQCLATLAVTRRETNSWKWTWFQLIYLFVLAYAFSFVTYRAVTALGWG